MDSLTRIRSSPARLLIAAAVGSSLAPILGQTAEVVVFGWFLAFTIHGVLTTRADRHERQLPILIIVLLVWYVAQMWHPNVPSVQVGMNGYVKSCYALLACFAGWRYRYHGIQ